ncbi:MAG: PKD domain-containing protein, partial [Candidatus Micrarchaeota archaeon]
MKKFGLFLIGAFVLVLFSSVSFSLILDSSTTFSDEDSALSLLESYKNKKIETSFPQPEKISLAPGPDESPSVIDNIDPSCGDTITLNATLSNNLLDCPRRGLTIGADNITLDCGGYSIIGNGTSFGVASENRQNITIKNCVIKNFSRGISLASTTNSTLTNNTVLNNTYGVVLVSSSNNNITENTAQNNTFGFLFAYSSSDNIISSSTALNNNEGFYLSDSSHNTFALDNARDNIGGFYLFSSPNNTFTESIAEKNTYGFFLESSPGNIFTKNTATENKFGFLYSSSNQSTVTNNTIANSSVAGVYSLSSTNNNFAANTVQNSSDAFFVVLSSNDNIFTSNAILNSNAGFYIYNSSGNTLESNVLANNLIGAYLSNSQLNSIYNNYFNSSTTNAFDNGNNIWNVSKAAGTNIIGGTNIGGNFWSDYQGVDYTGDGLGDTYLPYTSSGNITNGGDYLPLTEVNSPPIADANGPYSGVEGSPVTLNGSNSYDPDNSTGDNITSFEWDTDNDGVFEMTGAVVNKTYANSGIFTVTLRVTDRFGVSSNDTTTVNVSNAVPVVVCPTTINLSEGQLFNLTCNFTDYGMETHTATIDWGDGLIEPRAVSELNGSGNITAAHTYRENGSYVVIVNITDQDGGVGYNTTQIDVANVVPTVNCPASISVGEGASFDFKCQFSDLGVLDNHTAFIDWGDGSNESGTVNESNGLGNTTATHTYKENGTYTIVVNIADDDGGVGNGTTIVEVNNTSPQVVCPANASLPESGSFNLTCNFTDKGILDTHNATINWGDGSVEVGTLAESNGSGNVTATHLYNESGVYAVTVTVTDDDGGAGNSTVTVSVINLPPEVVCPVSASLSEGGSLNLTCNFTDKGISDTHNATINWGDGRIEIAPVDELNGSGNVTGSHIYLDNGNYTVTVTVTDDDGGAGNDTTFVSVSNLPPILVCPVNASLSEGNSFALVCNFSDVGILDIHNVTINWGDGINETGTVAELNGTGNVTANHIYRENGNYTV